MVEEAIGFLERIGRNIEYWFAHLVLKEEALVSQFVSFTWLAAIIMASIPYVEYMVSGGIPKRVPLSVVAYSASWLLLAMTVTVASIVGMARFTDKMLRQTRRESLEVFERASKYSGMLISMLGGLFFVIAYAVLPVFLGNEVTTYIWLLGVAGVLLGHSAGSYLVWEKTRYPGSREKSRVYLLSAILVLTSLVLIYLLDLHYIVKGLCATASMTLITLLHGYMLRRLANQMLDRVFGG